MNDIKFQRSRAGDIEKHGLFVWMGGLYAVEDERFDEEERCIQVRQLARGWTANPYDRWQYGEYSPERFQQDCVVEELLYAPRDDSQAIENATARRDRLRHLLIEKGMDSDEIDRLIKEFS
jgi:hypothetical protein